MFLTIIIFNLDTTRILNIIVTMNAEKITQFIKEKCLDVVGEKPNEDGILVLTPEQKEAYNLEEYKWERFHKSCEYWNWNFGYAGVAKEIIDNYHEWERDELYEFINFYFENDKYADEINEIIEVFE